MCKILTVVGTRPEAIKMAPVIRAINQKAGLRGSVCVTGQHRSMIDQVISAFGIAVDHDLNVFKSGASLGDLTCNLLRNLEGVLAREKPDWVLVHGDTTTTLAAALAAFYQRIPVGHVEAGLRTGDLLAPWPEEANRRITDSITNIFFAPTERARQNLLRENVPQEQILVTGNTAIDTLQQTVRLQRENPKFARECRECFSFLDPKRRLILVTGHRRENFGEGFINICEALARISEFPDVEILYPVHLNPSVREVVMDRLSGQLNIHLIEPVDYFSFVYLMSRSHLILTDSGGVQEEAPGLGKPVLVMREVTERPEAIEAGIARLVGTDVNSIVGAVEQLLCDPQEYARIAKATNPFGDGRAAERIVNHLAGMAPMAELAA